jgi:hypothetical protein
MKTFSQPAFPTWLVDESMAHGMTLRDYFAAAAMQAIAVESLKQNMGDIKLLTKNAYHIADAMIEARK